MFKNNNFTLNILIKDSSLYFLALHVKLSSLFFSTQILDIFSYENNSSYQKKLTCMIFNNLFLNSKYLIVIKNTRKGLNSISELFLNANWLEREASELSNIFFNNKKDTRNLMLPYGDNSTPFLKAFPTIGYYELYFDRSKDVIKASKVSIQF